MRRLYKASFLIMISLLLHFSAQAHKEIAATTASRFIENKGQWPKNVFFGARLSSGMIFIERNGITFKMYDAAAINAIYNNIHLHQPGSQEVSGHSFKIHWINSELPKAEGKNKQPDFVNYFLGNDSLQWGVHAAVYSDVLLHNIYPGIDVHYYEKDGHLKYDFIVHPNANPSLIRFEHQGVNSELSMGNIELSTAIGTVIEQAPYSFQAKKTTIASHYLKNDDATFGFYLATYDKTQLLTIDPVVVFASFSGSTSDNWGFSATYDNSGKLYAGGIVFGNGYPTSMGAFQTSAQSMIDMAITKFTASGGALLYSTYIGGSDTESPHSLVVSEQNELLIFGSTSSLDFPMSANAYDNTFNGGTLVVTDNIVKYSNGSDLFVSKLGVNGDLLIGSTYIGGSKNDGLNDEFNLSGLYFNYGDIFRGEIIVDPAGNSIIATTTSSIDFPIISGFQNSYAGGNHDGVVLKLNNNLSQLLWSTYIGGTTDDAVYSVQFDNNADLYVTGSTTSANFPTTPTTLYPSAIGSCDGFIAHIGANGQTLLQSTYIGTTLFDQSYFVQVDKSNNVFVLGQSKGNYPVTPLGAYNNANSKQFVHKLNSTLSSTVFSTVIGSGSSNIDLVPSAFLVNNCEDIYISSWGGKINSREKKVPGSTINMPLTADAFQSTTDGSDFYLAVLSPNATSLKYGTYFGGATTWEHVDGGTSRFDKKGNVYQAVCGGCGGISDFPTTVGAWSKTNQSTNCNIAVIKADVSSLTAIINGTVDTLVCKNEAITFINESKGGKTFEWDFGNGTKSTERSPTYTYPDTGFYNITLVVTDPNDCPPTDTTLMHLRVIPQVEVSVMPNDTICPGGSATLTASGASAYTWTPAATLNQSTGTIVQAKPTTQTTYKVSGNSVCNKDTAEITLHLFSLNHQISTIDSICPNVATAVSAGPGSSFQWSPAEAFTSTNSANTQIIISKSDTVFVDFTSSDGCAIHDSIVVKTIAPPSITLTQDTILCLGDSVQLKQNIIGNFTYRWTPSATLVAANVKEPIAFPSQETKYTSFVSNICNAVDSSTYLVRISKVQGSVSNDTTICSSDSLQLLASGGTDYWWTPSSTLSNTNTSNPLAFPTNKTTYTVHISNAHHCVDSMAIHINTIDKPSATYPTSKVLEYGQDFQISDEQKYSTSWWPSTYLSCDDCASPLVTLPDHNITYHYTLWDTEGCYLKDSVQIFVINKIYVPNAFTPNGDNMNDVFLFKSLSVDEFELQIFNRWGELLFTSNSIDHGWDGYYKGNLAQIDVYVWKVRYSRQHQNTHHEEIGRVSLIR